MTLSTAREKKQTQHFVYVGINLICITNNKDMEQDPPRGGWLLNSYERKLNKTKIHIDGKPTTGERYGHSQRKKCGIHHCVEIVDNPKEINRIKREIEAIEHNNTIDKKGDDKS
jgi:hypothetical protein